MAIDLRDHRLWAFLIILAGSAYVVGRSLLVLVDQPGEVFVWLRFVFWLGLALFVCGSSLRSYRDGRR